MLTPARQPRSSQRQPAPCRSPRCTRLPSLTPCSAREPQCRRASQLRTPAQPERRTSATACPCGEGTRSTRRAVRACEVACSAQAHAVRARVSLGCGRTGSACRRAAVALQQCAPAARCVALFWHTQRSLVLPCFPSTLPLATPSSLLPCPSSPFSFSPAPFPYSSSLSLFSVPSLCPPRSVSSCPCTHRLSRLRPPTATLARARSVCKPPPRSSQQRPYV